MSVVEVDDLTEVQVKGQRSRPSKKILTWRKKKAKEETSQETWTVLEFVHDVCKACACMLFIHVIYSLPVLMYVLHGCLWCVCVCTHSLHMHVCLCVYSRSDRVNPVACESELFMVWKPMRPSILSVTNDYLPPCAPTQTSRFSIWTARVVVSCLFYVFTCV